MPNILLVGNGAREHAMAEAISRSKQHPHLFSFMKAITPESLPSPRGFSPAAMQT